MARSALCFNPRARAAAAAIIQALLYKRVCSIDEKIKELMEQVYGEERLVARLAIVEHDCKRNHPDGGFKG